MAAPVGSQCLDCLKSSLPPTTERIRRWNATQHRFVTLGVIGLNVLVFLVGLLQGGVGRISAADRQAIDLGLFGPAVADGEWYRVVTSAFVHANVLHLAMNMFVIWLAGNLLEPALGRIRFGLLYLASLLAGSAGALLLSPNSLTVGASGAAFGLMGALAIGLRMRGVDIWRSGIGTIIMLNLVITFIVPGISIGAHLGGLVGGSVAGWAMLRTPSPKRSLADVAAPVLVMVAAVAVSYYAVA